MRSCPAGSRAGLGRVPVPDTWLVVADDPTVTCKAYVERLASTVNPRHRRMLATVIEHDRAETASDLERTMATLNAEPEYGRFWGTADVPPKGRAAVRSYYADLFARGGIGNLRSDVKRLVLDDYAIIAEFDVTTIWPWRTARELGCSIDVESGHYAIRRPLVTVIPFDEAGKMCGEFSYGGTFSWQRVPDGELSLGYLAWVKCFLPNA